MRVCQSHEVGTEPHDTLSLVCLQVVCEGAADDSGPLASRRSAELGLPPLLHSYELYLAGAEFDPFKQLDAWHEMCMSSLH